MVVIEANIETEVEPDTIPYSLVWTRGGARGTRYSGGETPCEEEDTVVQWTMQRIKLHPYVM